MHHCSWYFRENFGCKFSVIVIINNDRNTVVAQFLEHRAYAISQQHTPAISNDTTSQRIADYEFRFQLRDINKILLT